MIEGLALFKSHFADFSDCYVLIGGTASTLAMEELGGAFRATKDLDIVLCLESLDKSFASAFWNFIKAGNYQNKQKSNGAPIFYRFTKPQNENYPFMLELFSRVPDAIQLKEQAPTLTPIPIDEEVSSLSAILLDDDYYTFIHQSKRIIDGLTTIGAECIIPLKAKAYLDLSERKRKGEAVDSKNISKHKNDIFRLFTILDPRTPIFLADNIKIDLQSCFFQLSQEDIDLKPFGIKNTSSLEVLKQLSEIYKLPQKTVSPL